MNKNFIEDTLTLAGKFCNQEYIEKITILRNERERILHNIWREDVLPEKFEPYQKEAFYRDIDFDTAIYYSRKCLTDVTKYLKFLYSVAELSINYGELNRAEILLKKITEHYQKYADTDLLSISHYWLGHVYFLKNDYNAADTEIGKSLQFHHEDISNPRTVAMTTNAHGTIKVQLNQVDQGIALFNEAIKLSQTAHDNVTLMIAYMNLGNAYAVRGKWNQAIKSYISALNIKDIQGQKVNLTHIYLNLAIAYRYKNDLTQARENLQKALDLINETNNKYQKGLAYLSDATLNYLDGNLISATAFVTSAFVIFTEIGDRLSVAEAYKIMGMINRKNKEYEVALSFFENSRRINEDLNNFHNLAETLVEIGLFYEETDDKTNAIKSFKLAADCYEKIEADEKIKIVLKHIDRLES